jgi:hypothetical protein
MKDEDIDHAPESSIKQSDGTALHNEARAQDEARNLELLDAAADELNADVEDICNIRLTECGSSAI